MTYLIDRVFMWMSIEPVIGLLMIVASLVLFVGAYRSRGEPGSTFKWVRQLVEAGAVALLLLGLLWAFRSILNDNAATFSYNHGRVSEVNYASLMTIWGSPHVQRELEVTHSITVEEKEEIPRPDPADPPLYKTIKVERTIEQNSILSSVGEAVITLNRRRKGSAYYNGFEVNFTMTYEVVNDSPHTTDAAFMFPLSGDQVVYDNLVVTEDGRDIGRDLRIDWSAIRWDRKMKPGEKHTIVVRYASRGVEHFYYQIPYPRKVDGFAFRIVAPNVPGKDVNYPEGCLTPDGVTPTADGAGTVLEWKLEDAVTTAGMGLALPKPEQPGAAVGHVLGTSPYALMLLVVAICLTLLVRGFTINFVELALLSAVYCVLFLVMASVSDYYMGFTGSLVLGAAATVSMAWLLFRKRDSAVRWPIMGLVVFFTVLYPLSALLPEHRDAVDGMVAVGLIVYLFFLSLHTRLASPSAPADPAPATEPSGEPSATPA